VSVGSPWGWRLRVGFGWMWMWMWMWMWKGTCVCVVFKWCGCFEHSPRNGGGVWSSEEAAVIEPRHRFDLRCYSCVLCQNFWRSLPLRGTVCVQFNRSADPSEYNSPAGISCLFLCAIVGKAWYRSTTVARESHECLQFLDRGCYATVDHHFLHLPHHCEDTKPTQTPLNVLFPPNTPSLPLFFISPLAVAHEHFRNSRCPKYCTIANHRRGVVAGTQMGAVCSIST